MAKLNNRANIKTALPTKTYFKDLSCDHPTTMDFFQIRPTYVHEVVPGESVDINLSMMCRLEPLQEPFLGSAKFVHRAFFVPFRTCMFGWNNFIEDSPIASGSNIKFLSKVPTVSNGQILQMFMDIDAYHLIASTTSAYADIKLGQYNYNFTRKGKQFYNILSCLGLKVRFDESDTDMSALPLLAFAKIFFDAYSNSQYQNHLQMEKYFNQEVSKLLKADIYLLLDCTYLLYYSDDYFTSVFDNPVSPNNDTYSDLEVLDPTVSTTSTAKFKITTKASSNTNSEHTPIIGAGTSSHGTSLTAISDFAINFLHKMTDLFNRRRLAGSRVLDRYAAQYGYELDTEVLNRVKMIGKNEVPIIVSDVMQTTPNSIDGTTMNTGLGDYSGKGVAYQDNNNFVHFQAQKEYGFIMVISYIEPRFSYLYGRPRYLQHLTREQFYTPEFDNLGTQAVRVDELVSTNFDGAIAHSAFNDDDIFGYLPRYAEYKVGFDQVSGDFLFDSKNGSLDGWLLSRNFRMDHYLRDYDTEASPRHSLGFNEADGSRFENIFMRRNDTDLDTNFYDHFIVSLHFNVGSRSPIKPMFDFIDWDSEGRELNMKVNGTRVSD